MKLHHSPIRLEWLNPRLKNRIFLLTISEHLYTSSSLLDVVVRFHTINFQKVDTRYGVRLSRDTSQFFAQHGQSGYAAQI